MILFSTSRLLIVPSNYFDDTPTDGRPPLPGWLRSMDRTCENQLRVTTKRPVGDRCGLLTIGRDNSKPFSGSEPNESWVIPLSDWDSFDQAKYIASKSDSG